MRSYGIFKINYISETDGWLTRQQISNQGNYSPMGKNTNHNYTFKVNFKSFHRRTEKVNTAKPD